MMKIFRYLTTFTLAIFLSTSFVFAQLTEQDKQQRRQELDAYFTQELSKPVQGQAVRTGEINTKVSASARIGYNNNVNLNSSRDDDFYHRETAAGNISLNHAGIPHLLGSGILGVKGFFEYQGYDDFDDLDRQRMKVTPYISSKVSEDLTLIQSYELKYLRYLERDPLNYLSHEAKTRLQHKLTPAITHEAYGSLGYKDYTDRKALTPQGAFGSGDREDHYYNAGYRVQLRQSSLTWNVKGEWRRNDSNDQLEDFNDYDAYRISGSTSLRLIEKWTLTGLWGVDFRDFDERVIQGSATSTQEDDWFYAGGVLTWKINSYSSLDVSYTYHQNDSNDPRYEYSGSMTSLGYRIDF